MSADSHQCGTAGSGQDPAASIVDPRCRVPTTADADSNSRHRARCADWRHRDDHDRGPGEVLGSKDPPGVLSEEGSFEIVAQHADELALDGKRLLGRPAAERGGSQVFNHEWERPG